jgi:hypothetical protein
MEVKNPFKLEAILMLAFLAWPLVCLCLALIYNKPHQIGHAVHSAPPAVLQGK